MGQKHAWEKIVLNFYFSWTVNCNKYAVLTTLSSTLLRTKKKTVKKSEIWIKFFTMGCVFYRVGDWDDLQFNPHVSLHVGFKIQFAGIVLVFSQFDDVNIILTLPLTVTLALTPKGQWFVSVRQTGL